MTSGLLEKMSQSFADRIELDNAFRVHVKIEQSGHSDCITNFLDKHLIRGFRKPRNQ